MKGNLEVVKEVEKIKCYGNVLNVFFLQGGRKNARKWRSVKKSFTIWKGENAVPGAKQRDCVNSVAQIVKGGRGYHETKQKLSLEMF